MLPEDQFHSMLNRRWIRLAYPLRKNHIEYTCGPHVSHMWTHVSHMCSHVGHICCFNFTRFLTREEHFPHIRHMWGHANISVFRVSHMWPTWAHMWANVGSYLLALRSHVEKNTWNWNNTWNPHGNFTLFFRKERVANFSLFTVFLHFVGWNSVFIWKLLLCQESWIKYCFAIFLHWNPQFRNSKKVSLTLTLAPIFN